MADQYVWHNTAQDDSDSTWNSSTISHTTLAAGVTAASAGDTVWVHTGATVPHSETSSADINLNGPTIMASGPINIVGVDKNNSDVYTIATTAIVTINSTYDLDFNGDFAVYGLRIAISGTGYVGLEADVDEGVYFQDCYFDASSGTGTTGMLYEGTTRAYARFVDCTFDRGADDQIVGVAFYQTDFIGCTFIGSHATAVFFSPSAGSWRMIGCDLSQLSTSSPFNFFSGAGSVEMYGCRLGSGGFSEFVTTRARLHAYESDKDTGNDQYRTEIDEVMGVGACVVDTSEYRTGGGTYDGSTGYSYALTHDSASVTHIASYSPWMTGYLSTTGSKTWTAYITNDGTGDLTDKQVWLEVEYFGNSGNTLKTIGSDGDDDPTSSGTTQADDTGSTWQVNTTYNQKLSVTATVNQAGSYRWRVGSTTTDDVFICPKIEIT